MTPAAVWVLVALAAVLVGFAVPVLIQLRRTLKTTEATMESTGKKVNDALEQLTSTLNRVNRAVEGIEGRMAGLSTAFHALGGIGDTLLKVRSSISAVASLGSVLGGALLGAFGFGRRDRDDEPAGQEPVREELEREESTR